MKCMMVHNTEPLLYNWTRPLTLRLVRRLRRSVRRHQRIPQLARPVATYELLLLLLLLRAFI